jgi:hypothetical protein
MSDAPDVRDMFAMHTLLGREFGLLPSLVRGVRARDEARTVIVADHISKLTALLHEHHRGEDDLLWPRLLQRAPAEAGPVVELMRAQHATIAALVVEIERELKAWRASAASAHGDPLSGALDRMNPIIAEHTRTEEPRALPLVEKYITAAEYAELGTRGTASLAPAEQVLLVGMMMYDGGPDVLPRTVPSAVKEAAPGVYAAYSERVHGTATPPRGAR